MKIHISETTRQFLPDNYKVVERGEIEVKGKGSMKTYWLDYRENRRTLAQAAADVTANKSPVKAIEYNHDRRMSMPQYMLHNKSAEHSSDERRVYSPITFEDVARRSNVHSPMRNLFSGHGGRVSRSNSTGHAFLQSPSDVFGSLIVDTEEFLEDLHNRNSAGPNLNLLSPSSTPTPGGSYSGSKHLRQISARIKNKKASVGQVSSQVINSLLGETIHFKPSFIIQFTDDEILKLNQRQPPSAPVLQKGDSKDSSRRGEKDRSIMKRGSRFSQADSEKRALENLDEMVKNVYDNDIPGMCWPSSSPSTQHQQPSNSKSEGNLICLQNSCK